VAAQGNKKHGFRRRFARQRQFYAFERQEDGPKFIFKNSLFGMLRVTASLKIAPLSG